MLIFKLIFNILLLIVITSFSVKNMAPIEITYYDWNFHSHTAHISLLYVILSSFLIGYFLGKLNTVFGCMRLKSNLRTSGKTIESLNQELGKHREKEAASA
jgi:uncharacterized integral membrane protein